MRLVEQKMSLKRVCHLPWEHYWMQWAVYFERDYVACIKCNFLSAHRLEYVHQKMQHLPIDCWLPTLLLASMEIRELLHIQWDAAWCKLLQNNHSDQWPSIQSIRHMFEYSSHHDGIALTMNRPQFLHPRWLKIRWKIISLVKIWKTQF